MANDADDALLNALTKEEIGELVELIDPDVSCNLWLNCYVITNVVVYFTRVHISVNELIMMGP